MAIQLTTLGGLRIEGDVAGLDRLLTQHSRAALFVYLAVERRVPRESVTATFWPESDAENARHALRQGLYQLRKALGEVDWIESGAHELTVTDQVRTDAQAFTDATQRGAPEAASRLYHGPFLNGVHLVDLQPWESWVDGRRAQYSRAFRKGIRDLLDARRAAGDLEGAIAAAEHWAACEPSDDEAQHRLIESLAAAGERAEAIRQYEAYARLLEADDLHPRDETRALVERLRSAAGPLPALRSAPDQVPRSLPEHAGRPPKSERAAEPADRQPRRRWLAAAAVPIALLGALWAVRSSPVTRAPAPAATAIAVLPFSVRGAESAQYLGSGLVTLLATALDGAGTLRPVDSRATFAAVSNAGGFAGTVADQHRADRIAERLSAGMYVLGDVVEAGGRLHVEAAVYEIGTAQPRSNAAVSGSADSVFVLVDHLAARLLGGLGDPATDRLLRTAALTTSSLPALKEYLRGEGLMRTGDFELAADAYLAAIALDSTFALAHYRLALAREWAPLPGNADAAAAAARHGARLSTRDRMLLDAFRQWRAGDAVPAYRAYRTILTRYPDDVDAWFQMGEIQFHHLPLLGHPLGESEDAWRRILSHEPGNLFAMMHLARTFAVAGRATALDSLLARFRQLDTVTSFTDRRLDELLILRAVATGDSATALELARSVRRGESFSVWRIAAFLTAFSPDHALMRTVIRELNEDYPNPGQRAELHWYVSVLDLARGRVRDASVAMAEAARSEREVPSSRRRRAYEAVTEWFAATLPLPYTDSSLADVRRRAAAAWPLSRGPGTVFANGLDLGTSIQLEPLRQYVLGTLSLRLGDTAAAAAAAQRLERLAASSSASSLMRDLDRGLRARVAWGAGRPQESLRLLDALEVTDIQGDVTATPFAARANERFLHGEVLVSMGREAEALRWFASLGDGAVSEIPLQALSQLRQAEIHERRGDRGQAARHYARLLKLWWGADPEFQPQIDAARRRLSELTRPGS